LHSFRPLHRDALHPLQNVPEQEALLS